MRSLRAQLSEARDWLFPRRCLVKQRWIDEKTARAVMRTRLTAKCDRPK